MDAWEERRGFLTRGCQHATMVPCQRPAGKWPRHATLRNRQCRGHPAPNRFSSWLETNRITTSARNEAMDSVVLRRRKGDD
jgi:hypothetical protein